MSKNLLGGAILTAGILAGCSDSNNTVNEGNEMVKDSITVINDSVSKMLKEVVNQDIHGCMGESRNMKYKKVPLLETMVVEEKVNGDTVKSGVDNLMRMHEAWIDDGDEITEYVKQNREQSDYNGIGAFIMSDVEGKGSYEVDEYDVDEDIEDNIRFAGKVK